MGYSALASIAVNTISSISKSKQANAEAKGVIAEGNIAVKNKAQEITRKAASQTSSFLNSGLTLEGTPMNVINNTFNTGLEDLNQLKSNYNTKASNIVKSGRTSFIDSLMSNFSSLASSGMGGGGSGGFLGSGFSSSSSTLSGVNSFANSTFGLNNSIDGGQVWPTISK